MLTRLRVEGLGKGRFGIVAQVSIGDYMSIEYFGPLLRGSRDLVSRDVIMVAVAYISTSNSLTRVPNPRVASSHPIKLQPHLLSPLILYVGSSQC